MFIEMTGPFGGSVLDFGPPDTRYQMQYPTLPNSIDGSKSYVVGCRHCGGSHQGECHRIKSIEYHENGTVKRVEYHE